jgi:hypothetical protein
MPYSPSRGVHPCPKQNIATSPHLWDELLGMWQLCQIKIWCKLGESRWMKPTKLLRDQRKYVKLSTPLCK